MALPRDAQAVTYQPDPGDALDFGGRFAALTGGVAIDPASIAVTVDAADGVVVRSDAPFAPALADDETTIVFWLTVADGFEDDPMFDGMGIEVGVTFRFATAETPPRRFERTGVVNVRQR